VSDRLAALADFRADGTWVRVAAAGAGDLAEAVEDVQGPLPGVAGRGGAAGRMEGITQMILIKGLGVKIADFPVDAQGLFEVARCLLMAAELVQRVADAVERCGLAPPVVEVVSQAQ
jgi:hypothetical protein